MKLKIIFSIFFISAILLISYPLIGAENCQCEIPRIGGNERDVYIYTVETNGCCTSPVITSELAEHEVQVLNEGVWQIHSTYFIPQSTAQDKCCHSI